VSEKTLIDALFERDAVLRQAQVDHIVIALCASELLALV